MKILFKFRNFYLASTLLLCLPFNGTSQNNRNEEKANRESLIPKATFKLNITTLAIDPKKSIFVSTDISLQKNMSVDIGVGYFFYNYTPAQGDEEFMGWRARTGFKYYRLTTKNAVPYIGAELMMNLLNQKIFRNVCMSDCLFREEMMIDMQRTDAGLAFRSGIHFYAGKKDQFLFDLYAGFGVRKTIVKWDIPDSFTLPQSIFPYTDWGFKRGNRIVPNLILGLNFGLNFW